MDTPCYTDQEGCGHDDEKRRVAELCTEQRTCASCTSANDACVWDGMTCFSGGMSWFRDESWVLNSNDCPTVKGKKGKHSKKSRRKRNRKRRKSAKRNKNADKRLRR